MLHRGAAQCECGYNESCHTSQRVTSHIESHHTTDDGRQSCHCCSVLQCVAVCCSVLQCVVVCCSVLQCVCPSPRTSVCTPFLRTCNDRIADTSHVTVAVCCSVLQCVAVCCSVLQCAAVCCSVLQCVAVCCSVLQCISVLQCVAVCVPLPPNQCVYPLPTNLQR